MRLPFERRASFVHSNDLGSTALHVAAKGGHAEVVKLLIGRAEINKRDNAGHTALHDSVWNGHTLVAHLLIEAGAMTHLKNRSGDTPLTTALKLGDPSLTGLVRLLREASDAQAFKAAARKKELCFNATAAPDRRRDDAPRARRAPGRRRAARSVAATVQNWGARSWPTERDRSHGWHCRGRRPH